jgi:cysteine synthase
VSKRDHDVSLQKIGEQCVPEVGIEIASDSSESRKRTRVRVSDLNRVSAFRRETALLAKWSANRSLLDEFSGQHGIRGIGAGFVPALLDRLLGRDVQQVHDEEALVIAC